MRIFLPFTTLWNLCSSSKRFYKEIASYLSRRGGLLLCFPDRCGLPSLYTLPLHPVHVALFSPFVQFCSFTALWLKKIHISYSLLLQEKVSNALFRWITSARGRYIINLSLSLKCVSLVSADLPKNLWTGARISVNHFNWNKQCLINRITLSSIE